MAKQDDYVRYTIRVPADLYDRLKVAAGEKSVNAEVVERLEIAERAEELIGDVAKDRDKLAHQLRAMSAIQLPVGLRERVEFVAAKNNRSLTEEVIQALEAAYPPGPNLHDFFQSWFGAINIARGDTRLKMIEEANAEAKSYWPNMDVGFTLDGYLVQFHVSKRDK